MKRITNQWSRTATPSGVFRLLSLPIGVYLSGNFPNVMLADNELDRLQINSSDGRLHDEINFNIHDFITSDLALPCIVDDIKFL
jgi:hypothetical protein